MFALMEFGSQCRSDHDALSDCDVLFVSDAPQGRRDVARLCGHEKYDLSVYTWDGLASAAMRGDLFVDHVAREGRVIHDPEDRLRETLNGFCLRDSYRSTIESGLELYALLETIPRCGSGWGWAYDVLFVAFRTCAVPILAERGTFVYSHHELARELARCTGLAESMREAVGRARLGKKVHRMQAVVGDRCWSSLLDDIDTIGKHLGVDLHCRLVEPHPQPVTSSFPVPYDYVGIRRLERTLIREHGSLERASMRGHHEAVQAVLCPRGTYVCG